jgi:predicted DNA-binding helix-hairpin-helix protein
MPGVEKSQIQKAMELADRVSVNLEAPNNERLSRLAPHKNFLDELLLRIRWMDEIRINEPPTKTWNGRWPSIVTQFVAGGSDESDIELLTMTDWLVKNLHLQRAYFSAFNPIPDTPMENKTATEPLREHRLYQASFLLRDYGFELEELPFAEMGNLPLHTDPKLMWAQKNLVEKPLEINKVSRKALIRVPGIGPKGADAIILARRYSKLRDITVLKKLGISAERVAPFITMDGRRTSYQMSLF